MWHTFTPSVQQQCTAAQCHVSAPCPPRPSTTHVQHRGCPRPPSQRRGHPSRGVQHHHCGLDEVVCHKLDGRARHRLERVDRGTTVERGQALRLDHVLHAVHHAAVRHRHALCAVELHAPPHRVQRVSDELRAHRRRAAAPHLGQRVPPLRARHLVHRQLLLVRVVRGHGAGQVGHDAQHGQQHALVQPAHTLLREGGGQRLADGGVVARRARVREVRGDAHTRQVQRVEQQRLEHACGRAGRQPLQQPQRPAVCRRKHDLELVVHYKLEPHLGHQAQHVGSIAPVQTPPPSLPLRQVLECMP
mmetsp:Transcript_30667/g.78337  ORF Transcript_30667/g.78337 Transcript_30667/m.78337 type:complete len:303 (+) Transcript_30667:223-1131(+)